jgi:predicted RNA-binding protein
MAYFLDLFSPETYEAFTRSDRSVSGFRERHRGIAGRVKPGDKLLCYMTKLSRWVGILEVVQGPYEDSSPLFSQDKDPFVVRFRVRPTVWLAVDKGVPIHEDAVWNALSFTSGQSKSSSTWTGKLRGSLVQFSEQDGAFLDSLITSQAVDGNVYPVDEDEYRKLAGHRIRRADKDVSVIVPDDRDTTKDAVVPPPDEARESIRIQALLAEIGSRMGMQIWIPRSDRSAVLGEWRGDHQPVLDRLPLNYDDTTLKTIEQIDVLWLKGRAIRRAFEVEHTTSIYSGILRMADLLALQPNMDIRLHIVAPENRRGKVFQEIRRPVFSLLDRGPLSESCTFLSYDSVRELAEQHHLAHLSDSVLDEYEEDADSTG